MTTASMWEADIILVDSLACLDGWSKKRSHVFAGMILGVRFATVGFLKALEAEKLTGIGSMSVKFKPAIQTKAGLFFTDDFKMNHGETHRFLMDVMRWGKDHGSKWVELGAVDLSRWKCDKTLRDKAFSLTTLADAHNLAMELGGVDRPRSSRGTFMQSIAM